VLTKPASLGLVLRRFAPGKWSSADRRVLLVALLGLIVGVAAVAVAYLVSGFSFALAGDYRRYYAASQFVLHGANPYNQAALLVAEQQLRHLPSAINLGADGFVLVPFALWIVTPLALLPFWISFAVLATLATGARDGVVVARRDDLAPDDLRALAQAVQGRNGVRAVVLAGSPDGARAAIVAVTGGQPDATARSRAISVIGVAMST